MLAAEWFLVLASVDFPGNAVLRKRMFVELIHVDPEFSISIVVGREATTYPEIGISESRLP